MQNSIGCCWHLCGYKVKWQNGVCKDTLKSHLSGHHWGRRKEDGSGEKHWWDSKFNFYQLNNNEIKHTCQDCLWVQNPLCIGLHVIFFLSPSWELTGRKHYQGTQLVENVRLYQIRALKQVSFPQYTYMDSFQFTARLSSEKNTWTILNMNFC